MPSIVPFCNPVPNKSSGITPAMYNNKAETGGRECLRLRHQARRITLERPLDRCRAVNSAPKNSLVARPIADLAKHTVETQSEHFRIAWLREDLYDDFRVGTTAPAIL